jgi:hypothetical protein
MTYYTAMLSENDVLFFLWDMVSENAGRYHDISVLIAGGWAFSSIVLAGSFFDGRVQSMV